MADHGILFQRAMVRALLEDRKTQSRRILKPQPPSPYMRLLGPEMYHPVKIDRHGDEVEGEAVFGVYDEDGEWGTQIRIQPGDRLWVREAWRVGAGSDGRAPRELKPRSMTILYEAGGSLANQNDGAWKPDPAYPPLGMRPGWAGRMRASMHLPRWASRLTLIVTDVRVERLQDISEEDARAEGAYVGKASGRFATNEACMHFGDWNATARGWYQRLWWQINGLDSWEANPWVVAYTFTVHKANIDALAA